MDEYIKDIYDREDGIFFNSGKYGMIVNMTNGTILSDHGWKECSEELFSKLKKDMLYVIKGEGVLC